MKDYTLKIMLIGIISLLLLNGFNPISSKDVKPKSNEAIVSLDYNIYVDDDADPDWYDATHVKTIQEGIDNATSGQTIYVYA